MNTLGAFIFVAAVLAVLVCVFALVGRDVLVARKRRREFTASAKRAFIGGARFRTTRGRLGGAKTNVTSPWAQLEIADEQVRLSLVGMGALIAKGMDSRPPLVTTFSIGEIAGAEPFGRSGSGIRFRVADPADDRDGTVFWMRRRDREGIYSALATAGVPVRGGTTS